MVKVGNQQDVIDLADPRFPGDGDDAVGIPPVVPRPAGVEGLVSRIGLPARPRRRRKHVQWLFGAG